MSGPVVGSFNFVEHAANMKNIIPETAVIEKYFNSNVVVISLIYRLSDNYFGCVIGREYTYMYYPLPAASPKLLSESL